MAIPINIAVEDNLSEVVIRKMLKEAGKGYVVKTRFPTSARTYEQVDPSGFGYLKKNAIAFNSASTVTPTLMLVDLDNNLCAATLLTEWLKEPLEPNFIFRVAIKEIEAWLLADTKSMAGFLGLPEIKLPKKVERLSDPKATIVTLAKSSSIHDVVEGIAPPSGSLAEVGPYYQRMMAGFVRDCWDIEAASKNCDSLSRAVAHIKRFTPTSAK